jgi:4-cresol dehydrogenase (hydroxylating)
MVPEAPDPDRDRCGLVCCAPALPFDGKHARVVVSCLEAKSREYGFEPNISLLCVTPRQIDVAAFLAYDRDEERDESRALECHDDMLTSLVSQGYFPYRLGIHSMHLLPRPSDDLIRLYQTLKSALDPRDVLAPGRHDFRHFWTQ